MQPAVENLERGISSGSCALYWWRSATTIGLPFSHRQSNLFRGREPMMPGPAIGERIPDFSAPDQFGRVQNFSTIVGPAGAVILFIRSADW